MSAVIETLTCRHCGAEVEGDTFEQALLALGRHAAEGVEDGA